MLLRRATPEDLPAIRELEKQSPSAAHWNDREYHALYSSEFPVRVTLVAIDEKEIQRITGFVIARCVADEWEIENVVVAATRLRTGVGSALVRKLLQEAERAGASTVLLEVRESNLGARKLYEKIGFSVFGRRSEYYLDPVEDALVCKFSIAVP